MPNNPSREAFEAKFSQSPYEFEMDRCAPDSSWPGGYREYHVQCAWEGWQAGAQAEREACAMLAQNQTDPRPATDVERYLPGTKITEALMREAIAKAIRDRSAP